MWGESLYSNLLSQPSVLEFQKKNPRTKCNETSWLRWKNDNKKIHAKAGTKPVQTQRLFTALCNFLPIHHAVIFTPSLIYCAGRNKQYNESDDILWGEGCWQCAPWEPTYCVFAEAAAEQSAALDSLSHTSQEQDEALLACFVPCRSLTLLYAALLILWADTNDKTLWLNADVFVIVVYFLFLLFIPSSSPVNQTTFIIQKIRITIHNTIYEWAQIQSYTGMKRPLT